MTGRESTPVSAADHVRVQLRSELTAALKRGQRIRISIIRTAIAAIDNAEAVDPDPRAYGNEVPRRMLSHAEVRGVLMTQIEEHERAAAVYRSNGHEHEADELNQQAVVLRSLLLPDVYQLTAPVDAELIEEVKRDPTCVFWG